MVWSLQIFLTSVNILSGVHLSPVDKVGILQDNENYGEVYLAISLTPEASDKGWGSDFYGKFLPYEPHLDADEGTCEGFPDRNAT